VIGTCGSTEIGRVLESGKTIFFRSEVIFVTLAVHIIY
jgi:hypothetical protein